MNHPTSPFGEKSLTLVAGVFESASNADRLAAQLRLEPGLHTVVVHPDDAHIARKLEPEEKGIWRTLLRSHARFMPIGAFIGATVAFGLIQGQWPGAASSPMMAVLFLSVIGAFFGGFFAGLLTLRPDHGIVIRQVRAALRRGRHAVIVHPLNELRARRAVAAIEGAGAAAVRSL